MTNTNFEFPEDNSSIKEPVVMISSNKDIFLAYQELFESCNIDLFQSHIEKKVEGVDYTQEPRIVLLPSGIVSIVCAEDNRKVWGDYNTPQYKDLLVQAHRLIKEENSKNVHTDNLTFEKQINNSTYSINLFPFFDSPSSQIIIDMLDKKNLSSKRRSIK